MSFEEGAPIVKDNQAMRSKHYKALMEWDLMPKYTLALYQG